MVSMDGGTVLNSFSIVANNALTRLRGDSIGAILARGASGAFVVNVLGEGLALGVQIFLARVMGTEHYGVYVYALTWLYVLVLVTMLGLDMALLRYVPAYRAQGAYGALRGIVQRSNQFTLVASLVVSMMGAVITWALQPRLGLELTYTFWIGYAMLPVLALSRLCKAALRSLKHIVLAQLPELVLRPVLLVLLVGAAYILFPQLVNGPRVMGLYFVATTVTFFVSTHWLRQNLPAPVKASVPHYRSREWVTVALPLMLVSGVFLLLNRVDTLMIGLLVDTTEAGIYTVASRLTTLTTFGLTTAQLIVAPMISELIAQDRMKTLQRMVTLTVWGALAFSLPSTLALLIWGRWALGLFGSAFSVAYQVLIVLVIGQLVDVLTGPVGYMLSMTGYQNQLVLILALALLMNVIMNYLLIPTLGVVGVALATALTTAGWNVVAALFVYRRLHINCSIFRTTKV